jgi:hypothetical protein
MILQSAGMQYFIKELLILRLVILTRKLRRWTKQVSGTPESFSVEQNYFREHPKASPLNKTTFGNTRKLLRWTKLLSGTPERSAVGQNRFREHPKASPLDKTTFGNTRKLLR